jgi:hypothetical protein
MPKPPNFISIRVRTRESEQASIGGLNMRERDIEIYLRDQVKKAGGKAYKFESPGNDGVPDRIVIFPENKIYFVELKAPGKKPRPLQLKQMRILEAFGCTVKVIDSKESVDEFIVKVDAN